MLQTVELLNELLERGLSFRYSPERFAALTGGGQPFRSPTRTVQIQSGEMIEEVIQPVLNTISVDCKQHEALTKLAGAWPRLLAAQLALYKMARAGELDNESHRLIQAMCTDEEWERGVTEPGYRTIHPFIRLDAMLVDGTFKVIDINSTRPAGVGDLMVYHAALNGHFDTTLRQYQTAQCFAETVRRCIDDWAGERNLPGESIPVNVIVRPTDGDWNNFHNLNTSLLGAGFSSAIVTPDDIRNGEATAIIRGRIKEGDPAYTKLQEHYPLNRCIMSPLYRRFLGNKVWMYLLRCKPFETIFREYLGEAYGLFDEAFAEIGIIKDGIIHMPDQSKWRLNEVDRQSWVFKDPASSSGRRMILGFAMGKKKWQDALTSIRDGWIAQRFYRLSGMFSVAGPDGEPIERKLFTKYGIYIFGSDLAGLEFNAREFPVVHGARNTYFNSILHRPD